jgi:uncharacterized phage protein (TIGR02220 family)
MEMIEEHIAYFCQVDRVLLDDSTHEFMIVNWMRHHVPMNPSVLSSVTKELGLVRSAKLKETWTYLQTHGGHLPTINTSPLDTSPTPVLQVIPEKLSFHDNYNNVKEQQEQLEQPTTEDKITGVNVFGSSSEVTILKGYASLPTLEEQDQTDQMREPKNQQEEPDEGAWNSFQSILAGKAKIEHPAQEGNQPNVEPWLDSRKTGINPPSDSADPSPRMENPEEEILSYFNQQMCTGYRFDNPSTNKVIRAQLAVGFTVEDFHQVIDQKKADWKGTKYEMHLNPYALFGDKFETYLRQSPRADLKFSGKRIPMSTFTSKTLRKV